jgi:histidine ammonia-lyase
MADNTAGIIGIELLAAAQGIGFHAPRRTSAPLQQAIAAIRAVAAPYTEDRFFAPDIAKAALLAEDQDFASIAALRL